MHQRLSKVIVGIVVAGALATGAMALNVPEPQAAQAAKAKAVKDQGEYDLTQAIQKETDPQKKLDLLKSWEQKYPESDYKDDRTLMTAQIYSQMSMKVMMAAYAPDIADTSVKAAQVMLDNLDSYFAPALKPPAVADADWAKARSTTELQSHTVLGYVAMNRKDEANAEKEFRKVLELSPEYAQISYWLGSVIARQRKTERIPEALYHFARATAVTGAQKLDPVTLAAAEKYLKGAYSGYHGDDEGLPELKALAAKSPFPPAGWTIKSIVDIDKEKAGSEADFEKAHPDVVLWRKIRTALQAADGATYFGQIKGAGIPPAGQAGFSMFKAKVISQPNPKELLVNVDNASGDAMLKFETPLKTVDANMAIEFTGVVEAYAKDPYTLTFLITEKADIKGLPEGAFNSDKKAVKKPAVKKAGPRKKK